MGNLPVMAPVFANRLITGRKLRPEARGAVTGNFAKRLIAGRQRSAATTKNEPF